MKTSSDSSGDDPNTPSWLKDPPLESINIASVLSLDSESQSQQQQQQLQQQQQQQQQRRRRRRRGYESDDEESLEDCCCCPLDPCLATFVLFHCCCGFLGCAAIAANVYHLTKTNQTGVTTGLTIHGLVENIIRVYTILMGGVIVCCEIDWKFLTRRLKLLDLWLLRGLFYCYVGFSTLDLDAETIETPECVVGLALVFAGVLYVAMGALCLKAHVMARRRNQYTEIEGDVSGATYESV